MPAPFLEGRNIAESRGPDSPRFLRSTGTYRCGTALDFDQLPRSTLVKGTRSVELFSCKERIA